MSHQVHRSAVTGEYVTPEHAAAHPDTTVTETVPEPDDLVELYEEAEPGGHPKTSDHPLP